MTPYNLRFSVFNSAKDFLEQSYKANLAAWEALDKTATDLAPKFPTMAEVLEKAFEINKFVSDANHKELVKATKNLTGF